MQNSTIGAFRKRLSNRGYSYIHIKRVRHSFLRQERYLVSAREPLSSSFVEVELTISEMYTMFR